MSDFFSSSGPKAASAAGRRRHGLTLTEVFVVLGVIVVFIAMLISAVESAREAARRAHCTNNLRQIGLALQNYGDVYKCFPADAVWGQDSDELPQKPYHYPWTTPLWPFMTGHPLYDAINKRIPIMANQLDPTEFTGQKSTTTPPAYGSNGFPALQAQPFPVFRCPSDTTFRSPGELPLTMMWSNFAASEGVGYFPAKLVKTERGDRPLGSAPKDHKGIFPFAEFTSPRLIRDGASFTVAAAEVTGGSVSNQPQTTDSRLVLHEFPEITYAGPIPDPPNWTTGQSNKPPGFPLKGGTGKPRSQLFIHRQPEVRAPLVFRAVWAALTNSVTGGAPCAGGNFYLGALGGPCGGDDGFELHTDAGASRPIYGIAPTYNALYPPNSDWPGPDSLHPGIVMALFADGHIEPIQENIDYRVWASLNTRAGGESLPDREAEELTSTER